MILIGWIIDLMNLIDWMIDSLSDFDRLNDFDKLIACLTD